MISTHSLRILSINNITVKSDSNDVKHDGRIWKSEGMSSYIILFFFEFARFICVSTCTSAKSSVSILDATNFTQSSKRKRRHKG